MAIRTLSYIKSRFATGAIPTEADFADQCDTLIALSQAKVMSFAIKTSPAGANQKPVGSTIQDDALIGKTLLDVQIINGIGTANSIANISLNSTTGTLSYGYVLSDGDIVIVFYVPTLI